MTEGVGKPSLDLLASDASIHSADFLTAFKNQIGKGNFVADCYHGTTVREYELYTGEVTVDGKLFQVRTTKSEAEPNDSIMVVKAPAGSGDSKHSQVTIMGEGALALHYRLINSKG
jgi:hypothetical protein